jgi:hypothetical protein
MPRAALSPWQAQRLSLLVLPQQDPPPISAEVYWWRNLWLGLRDESMIGIGITGDYASLQPLLDEYGAYASDIFFPFPKRLTARRKRGQGLLLITFAPEKLRRVADKIIEPGTWPG